MNKNNGQPLQNAFQVASLCMLKKKELIGLHTNFQSGNNLQPFDFSLDSRPKNFNPDITKSAVFFFM